MEKRNRFFSGRRRDDAKRQIIITDPSVCYYCKSKGLKDTDKYCPNCGFPQRGTQAEMKMFIRDMNLKERLLFDKKNAIRKAQTILYVLAILNPALSFFLYLAVDGASFIIFVSGIIMGLIYFILVLWSKKNPFTAILCGFFFYITMIAINAIIIPSSLFSGIIIKIIIIGGFIYGFKGAKDAEKLEKELKEIKDSKNFSQSDDLPEVPNQ